VRVVATDGLAGADPFAHPSTAALIASALAEDLGRGDVTTSTVVPPGARARTALVAREECVVAGLPLAALVLAQVAGPGAIAPVVTLRMREGTRVAAGTTLRDDRRPPRGRPVGGACPLEPRPASLGRGHRDAPLRRRRARYRAAIVDTRKTIPGLRLLQKYAVRVGGGRNHRFGLDDGVLVKDNHIAACRSLGEAVARARAGAPHVLRVEVECDALPQVREALSAGADAILLDNMTPALVAEACRSIGGRALVEVSGGVSLDTVRAYAKAGADLISVGRLTHSVTAVDIGLDFVAARARQGASPPAARTTLGARR
jgi:nicotinate-nucleotide pyrophosphorylase (carboxylating)